jgi:hypothetical protein
MKITRRQLRRIIRESLDASPEERQKIEQLYWNGEDGNWSQREHAVAMIEAFGIDPASLRVWEIALPWGEFYEPWAGSQDHAWGINGWIANSDEPGFTVQDVEDIVDVFNSQNEAQLSVTKSSSAGDDHWMQMETAGENMATEEMVEDIYDGVSIAANKVMNK